MVWLKSTNATVSDVVCAGPEVVKDSRLNDISSLHDECVSTGEKHLGRLAQEAKSLILSLRVLPPTDFVLHQSVASESLSVDAFSYKDDVYVAVAAPSVESCMVLQWDHIEMNFRTFDNITGRSVSPPPVPLCRFSVFQVG